jgi:hypothetical protein
MIRLAICIPAYGDTKAKFTLSLANALIKLHSAAIVDHEGNPVPIETEMFMVSCSMLTESRTRLVAEAVGWEATHLLWLDADHVFPANAILRLLAHNVDVVGANYPRRCIPTAPTAAKTVSEDDDNRNLVYTTMEKAHDNLVEEVDHMGFGVCLMNMAVFDLMQIHAEEHGDGNFLPLFKFTEIPGKAGPIGEDVFFFRKLREAGGRVFVDHALSWEVGHIHEMIMTNAHAVAQKDRWRQNAKEKTAQLEKKIEELEDAA